jgi:iron complex outermembrane receptor protein
MFKSALLLFICTFLEAHSLFAHALADTDSLLQYRLDEVQVSAFGEARPALKTPMAIEIVNAQDIQRDQQLHIAPVLNRLPGLYMQSSNLNTNRLSIRGMGARTLFGTSKIRAFWNGIPLSSGEGSTDIEDIDLSLLDHIEVIKGPASSLYGAGLGGAVLLKSTFVEVEKPQDFISQQFSTGAFGLQRLVTQVKHLSPRLNIQANYNHSHWDGYRANNRYDRGQFSLQSSYKDGEDRQWNLLLSRIDLKAFIPSSLNRDMYENSPREAAPNWANAAGYEDYIKWVGGLSLNQEISTKSRLETAIFGQIRHNYEPRPFNILDEEQYWVGVRSQLFIDLSDKLKLQSGGELFEDRYAWKTFEISDLEQGELLADNVQNRRFVNFFGRLQWQLSHAWLLETGLNLNQTQYKNTDQNTDIALRKTFSPVLSPRVALNYQWRSNHSWFISASHGFSPPTVEESLTPEGNLNPGIQPEAGWNLESGWKGVMWQGRFNYQLSVYSMHIRDLLVTRRDAEDAFIGINAGRSLHQGIELSLQGLVFDNNQWQLSAFANGTLNNQRFDDFVDGDNDFTGNELTGVPDRQANAGIDFSHRTGFYGNLNATHIGTMPMRDDNSVYSEAYTVFNTKGGIQRRLPNQWILRLEGGLQNVFDQKYASQILVNASSFGGAAPRYYYPGLPRHGFVSIQLSFRN